MINFYLPDFYEFYRLNVFLHFLLKEYPEKFYSNIRIGAIYGCFPNQIWNGGRYSGGTSADISNIEHTIKEINKLGIPVRFTYTNSVLTEEHLNDKQCNFVTDCAHNGFNEILVNSPILEEYLRAKYPNYNFISSATRCIRDINSINKLTSNNKYKLVLGDYRDNFNIGYLSQLQNKDKIELLINPVCKQNCTYREKHYERISQQQLGVDVTIPDPNCECEGYAFFELLQKNTIMTVEDLYNRYYNMGFRHFKIEGRNNHFSDVIDSYVYYMVRPEYKDEIRNLLTKAFI